MPSVTKLEDRGTNWSISYDDGGYDTVPKDPNVIDTAAAQADAMGQKELAAKFRMWAANIRAKGVPVIVPMSTGTGVLLIGSIVVGAYILFRKML